MHQNLVSGGGLQLDWFSISSDALWDCCGEEGDCVYTSDQNKFSLSCLGAEIEEL